MNQLQGKLSALPQAQPWMVEAWENPRQCRDGGFARVAVLDDNEVLKLTCCEATNALFAWLLKHQHRRDLALPAVLECYGPVATAPEDFVYVGWRIERLFIPPDTSAQARARARAAALFEWAKPSYPHKQARLISPQRYAQLLAALAEEQELSTGNGGSHAELALAMALRTTAQLRKTFLFLREFVQRTNSELDLLTGDNILLNAFGEPCLSDPVCAAAEGRATAVKATSAHAVLAWLPVRAHGLEVETVAFSSPALSRAQALRRAAQLTRLSVAARVCGYASADHERHLARRGRREPIWRYPQLRARLAHDTYLQALV
jgi:hypothetical protein